MTDPIISPWFIYLLGVVEGVRALFIFLTFVSGVILFVGFIVGLVAKYGTCPSEERWRESTKSLWKKMRNFSILPFVFLFMLSVLIPTKETLIWMCVAKYVTYQNVEKAIDAGKNVKDELKKDMLDLIEAIRGEQEQKEQ